MRAFIIAMLLVVSVVSASAQSKKGKSTRRSTARPAPTRTTTDSTSHIASALLAQAAPPVRSESIESSSTSLRESPSPAVVSASEDMIPRRNVVSINPLKFFLMYNISYSRSLTNWFVATVGIQAPTTLTDDQPGGFGLNAEVSFYPLGSAFRGFHITPNLSWNTITFTPDGVDPEFGATKTEKNFTAGLLVGWHMEPWTNVVMEYAVGADYNFQPTSERTALGLFSHRSGVSPTFRVNVGYAW